MLDLVLNNEFLKILFISMLPITELRLSIPYFILTEQIMWQKVFIISIIGNIIIGLLVVYIIAPMMLLSTNGCILTKASDICVRLRPCFCATL